MTQEIKKSSRWRRKKDGVVVSVVYVQMGWNPVTNGQEARDVRWRREDNERTGDCFPDEFLKLYEPLEVSA